MARPTEKRRRGHGEGTLIDKPNGRVKAQVFVNGRRLSQTFDGRKEAQKRIRDTQSKAEQGMLPVDGGKVTVAAFLDQWLAAITPSVKPMTAQGYGVIIRLHLKPTLGTMKLAALRADHLQSLYAAKLEGELSKRTTQLCHAVIRHALADALKWGLISGSQRGRRDHAATADKVGDEGLDARTGESIPARHSRNAT